MGFPRNLGDPGVSTDATWLGSHESKNPGPGGVPTPTGDTNNGHLGGTAKRRQRSAAEGHREVGAARNSDEDGNQTVGTRGAKGCRITELSEGKTMGASEPASVSTKQRRIAELARQMPEKAMTSLSQHMDIDWMREAFRRTRKDGATGIDGQTAS